MVEYAVKTIRDMDEILNAARKAGKPVLIVGATGVGKTAVAMQFAKKNRLPLKKFKPGDMEDVGDMLGKIIVEGGRSKFTYTDWFPEKRNTVFLIDEVNRCNPFIQQALFEVIQYKEFNGHKLPAGTFIVMTANIQEGKDKYIVIEMDDAFVERSMKIKLVPTTEEVINYGVKKEWDERILTFFSIYSQYIKVDTDGNGVPPRAIEDCSDSLKAGLPVQHADVYLGSEIGGQLMHFVSEDYKKIPRYDELKRNPALLRRMPDQYGLWYLYTKRIMDECMQQASYHPLVGKIVEALVGKYPDIFTGILALYPTVDVHNFLVDFKVNDKKIFNEIKTVIKEFQDAVGVE